MIQRIIDWYNGYTLEEKLELELLEEYATFQSVKDAATELNEMIMRIPMYNRTGLIRKEKIYKPNDFNYIIGFNIYEYEITNHSIECLYTRLFCEDEVNKITRAGSDTLSKIKILNEPNSKLRIKMIIRNSDDKKLEYCKEYCVKDLIREFNLSAY